LALLGFLADLIGPSLLKENTLQLANFEKMSSKESVVAEMATSAPGKASGAVPTTNLVSGDVELLGLCPKLVFIYLT
jgi:hypothetical protein